MSTTQAPTLTRAAFVAWLATFPDEANVGLPGCGEDCPIAEFFWQLEKPPLSVFVDVTVVKFGNDDSGEMDYVTVPLPEWTVAFVESVDNFGDEHDGPITAGTAREILARIPDEGGVPAS